MKPSERIISEAVKPAVTEDRRGRRLTLRSLTALDTLRLFKAAGPVLAQNEPWLSMASLAFAVTEIDGVPVPTPVSEAQIESLIDRLGDNGLAAIAGTLEASPAEDPSLPRGNSPGTPF
jgi:hypothetical protein